MAVRHTIWRPDTCGCELAVEWDDAVADVDRVHTIVSGIPCAAHDDGSARESHPLHADRPAVRLRVNAQAIGQRVLAENQGKNFAIGALIDHAPDLTPADVTWRFNDQRKIVLFAPKLGNRKTAAQAALMVRFGAGSVILE